MGCCGGCSQVGRQFLLLLWKNFILQIRRPIGTVFEVILPIIAVLFIVVLQVGLFSVENKCFVTFDSDNLNIPVSLDVNFSGLPVFGPDPAATFSLYYTPNTTKTTDVVQILGNKLPSSVSSFRGFSTETEMVEALRSANSSTCFRSGAGIVFNNLEGNDLSYTIRLRHEVGLQDSWNTDLRGPRFEPPGPRISNSYLSEGFMHLQQLVGESIIQSKSVMYVPVDVSVRQFPYPAYRVDPFLSSIGAFLPILLVMAFLYTAGIIVKELVLEKETRIRESMLMMGLRQWVLWSTWFLKEFLFLLFSVLIISILIKARVFPNSDFFLILFFFLTFVISMISFCFFVSVWFDSSRVGFIVGFVAWFVNYFPFLFLASRYDELSRAAKVSSCLLSNTCLGLGVEVISQLEQRQEGLTWQNAGSHISADDDFSMAWIYGMLLLDSLIYMTVAWYVNAVKPGQYGVPKPFYFPFLPSYWCGVGCSKEHVGITGSGIQEDPSAHEDVDTRLRAGIKIRNLSKTYDNSLFRRLVGFFFNLEPPKKAVDNLNLDMYDGQITALLGHNGAGKTTTMSMLTGLYTPTTGSAEIGGFNILTEIDEIRHSLGICPQHNILFDRLTVSEHLSFFLRLKGIFDKNIVRKEVEDMIADLQLVGKSKIQSSRLSGGMKRKLSVGIALVGGSKVVILDEPTSGMDPYARRATWDLLIKHKQNRTMLLTTHFMDEADILGDRIAIMAEGKLCCSGSSLFLKSRYGVGYHMTIVKEPGCVSQKVEQLVQSFVPAAKQETDVGAELSFTLPSAAAPKFPDLFDSLDGLKAELGVSSFGVSVTTMEEVFIKVGENSGESLDERLKRGTSIRSKSPVPTIGQTRSPTPTSPIRDTAVVVASLDGEEDTEVVPHLPSSQEGLQIKVTNGADSTGLIDSSDQLSYNFTPNTGMVLWLQQFWAMFVKRFYNSLRFYGAVVSQLVLPLLFVIFGLAVAVTVPSNQTDDPARELQIINSALSTENAIVFYAQYGNSINLSNFTAQDIQATDYVDYRAGVEEIVNRVSRGTFNETSDCCQYDHQLLDPFCASRSARDLTDVCGNNGNFGYHACTECLRCCRSTDIQSTLPSCTNPSTVSFGGITNDAFCPSPPSLSVSDLSDLSAARAAGFLRSRNTFVAEHLLTQSEMDPLVFFRRYQAGITVTPQDPVYTLCNCQRQSNGNQPLACPILNNGLKACTEGPDNCPMYSLLLAECPGNATGPDLCNRNDTDCFSVDSYSAEFVQTQSCGRGEMACMAEEADRLVSTLHPNPEPSKETVTVWYNNAAFHTPPAALNALHNMLLKQATGTRDINLNVINHPLPRNDDARLQDALTDPTGFGVSILVVFGFSFLLASFVLFLVNEKESKAKHLQFVSGVSPTSYWLSTYAWDLINALGPIIISVIIFAIFQVEAFSGEALGAIFLVLLLTCWAGIPISYIFSFLFSNSLAAFGILMLIYFFSSLLLLTVVILVQFFVENGVDIADKLHYIFLLSPTYALSAALNDLFLNQNVKNFCQQTPRACTEGSGARFVDNPLDFSRPGLGVTCVYLFLLGMVLFVLTLLIQRKFFRPELMHLLGLGNKSGLVHTAAVAEPLLHGQDSDVEAERKKVMSEATNENDVVVIRNLVKVYSKHVSGCSIRPPKTAVGGINLAIPSGECFGLLGVNGAGKTTTFSILTGEISMTNGTAIIAGYDVRTNIKDVQQRVGYCPQFDALIERLTGQELLTMFARLRGIPERQIKEVVDTEVRRLDLGKYAHKRCGTYSGGNKRKLSTAVALVGNPPIVMLDEPTTGMDPTTRRYLWDVLTNVTREGRSIILTSHSMEECEALCTRLAIMVNGSFKCLGSTQHLKNKYGAGFTLQAKVKLSPAPPPDQLQRKGSKRISLRRSHSKESGHNSPSHHHENMALSEVSSSVTGPVDITNTTASSASTFNPYDTTQLHAFIKQAFSGAILMEEHQGAVTYQLPSAGVTWSTVFRQLESNKERLGIVDYSVSQTTLDQVFINFAKEQEDTE